MKNFIPTDKRSITAIKAVKLLKEHGTEVSPESAKLILDFLYEFVKLSSIEVINRKSCKKIPDKMTPRKLFNSQQIKK